MVRAPDRLGQGGDAAGPDTIEALSSFFDPVVFEVGEVIFRQDDPTDAFYVVDAGEVRLEVRSDEVDSDATLAFIGPGAMLGEIGVLTGAPRSATAIAHVRVLARRMSIDTVEGLYRDRPVEGLAVARLLGQTAARRVRDANLQHEEHLFADRGDPVVDAMVADAVTAQRAFSEWGEDSVDALLRDIAVAVAEQAVDLAAATIAETGIGVVDDKAEKILFGSLGVYATLAGRPGSGRFADDTERDVTEYASAAGVVFGMAPVTEPVSTYVNKVLIALKGRNALILSPHRASATTAATVDDLVHDVLAQHGAPPKIVQLVRDRASRQRTARFMRHRDVSLIVATGGAAMVEAAYRSGTPALGVGAGNAPVWVAPDADFEHVAACVVASKSYDNGLICGAEQHLVVEAALADRLVAALEAAGAAVLDRPTSSRFVEAAFLDNGRLRAALIGRTAAEIAAATGLSVPDGTQLLVITGDANKADGAYATERLAPIVTLYATSGDSDAIELCRTLLAYEGTGHTAVIHTEDEERIDRFARSMPASRILVGVPAAQGCGGAMTGLVPSMTLGCGTFGGTATTDNVGFRNLLNVKRVARMNFTNAMNARRLSER
jgi:acyl-CoA reductase-like NAD-dependent aldehyde dehydrogenase